MIFARFHWTARKPTLIARPRLAPAALEGAAGAKAPCSLRSRQLRRGSATASGAPRAAIASLSSSRLQPPGKDDRPQRYRGGQEKDAGSDGGRGRLHARDAISHEG